MNLKKCFEERKLRFIKPDLLKANKSVEIAKIKLKEAEKLAESGFYGNALVTAYAAMFHCGRALLFKDGVVEKSHYCLIQYLRENYVKTGLVENGIITLMDSFREERHSVLYSLEKIEIKPKETKEAIENARKFLNIVKNILKESKIDQ